MVRQTLICALLLNGCYGIVDDPNDITPTAGGTATEPPEAGGGSDGGTAGQGGTGGGHGAAFAGEGGQGEGGGDVSKLSETVWQLPEPEHTYKCLPWPIPEGTCILKRALDAHAAYGIDTCEPVARDCLVVSSEDGGSIVTVWHDGFRTYVDQAELVDGVCPLEC